MMLNNDGTAVEQASLGMTNAEQIGLETAQEDDERFVEGLERYPDVRHQLTPEQLEAREQRRVELERTFSYDQYKVVRKEMHAGAYDPSVMVRAKSITFNRACINSLENVSYVRIYFSEVLGRLAIQPVEKNSPHAMRWCSDSKGKRSPRSVTCPDLTEWLYKTMGWKKGIRYKVLGYLIEADGEMVYVFDFKYARLYNERHKDEEGRIQPIDRKGYYPQDLSDSMTMSVDEYRQSVAVEEVNGLINAETLVEADKLGRQTAEDGAEAAEETDAETAQTTEEAAENSTNNNPSHGYEPTYEEPASDRSYNTGLVADGVAKSALIL